MAIFFNFSPSSNYLHPLQIENYDSNSRVVVDEDDNDKIRLERVALLNCYYLDERNHKFTNRKSSPIIKIAI